MRVWETFREGSRLFRLHFGQLLLLNTITYLPAALIAYVIASESMPIALEGEQLERWTALLAFLLLGMSLWSFVSMMTLHFAVGDAYETGSCDWRESLRRCVPRLLTFAGFVGLGTLGSGLLIGLIVAAAATGMAVVALVGVLVGIAALIAFMAVLTIGVPVIVREDVGVRNAYRRAWTLARQRLLSIIGLIVLTLLIVGFCERLLSGAITGGFEATAQADPTKVLIGAFASFTIPTLLFTPWTVAIVTVAYIKLRLASGESLSDGAPRPVDGAPPAAHLTARRSGGSPIGVAATPDADIGALFDLVRSRTTTPDPLVAGADSEPRPADAGLPSELEALIGATSTDMDRQADGDSALHLHRSQQPAGVGARPRWSEPLGGG